MRMRAERTIVVAADCPVPVVSRKALRLAAVLLAFPACVIAAYGMY